MRTIPLTKGLEAVVDGADYEALSAFKWYAVVDAAGRAYARRTLPRCPGKKRGTIWMHRQIMGPVPALVDHRDGNGLNNRRYNLRRATNAQNQQNRQLNKRFKGVTWSKKVNQFQAQIRVLGARQWLGYFEIEESAARAYDKAAIEFFGEFAQLNFPR